MLRFIFTLPFIDIDYGAEKNVTKKMLSKKKQNLYIEEGADRCCTHAAAIGKYANQRKKNKNILKRLAYFQKCFAYSSIYLTRTFNSHHHYENTLLNRLFHVTRRNMRKSICLHDTKTDSPIGFGISTMVDGNGDDDINKIVVRMSKFSITNPK